MRIRIAHETRYSYEQPARAVLQLLRMTPRDHEGQHVIGWRVEPSAEGRLRAGEDCYGNICHAFEIEEPVRNLRLLVTGEVEMHDTAGVTRGAVERVPDPFYLRETALTASDDAIRSFALESSAGAGSDRLLQLHDLVSRINREMTFDTNPTDSGTTAIESFGMKRGVCQDLTHLFLACSRHLGVPARYVSGYFHRADGVTEQDAGHAWAEAKVEGLGWVGFDPANGISTTDAHVRVAVGLDYLAAAPIRGSRRGGGSEKLDVTLRVDTAPARSQSQGQTQS